MKLVDRTGQVWEYPFYDEFGLRLIVGPPVHHTNGGWYHPVLRLNTGEQKKFYTDESDSWTNDWVRLF